MFFERFHSVPHICVALQATHKLVCVALQTTHKLQFLIHTHTHTHTHTHIQFFTHTHMHEHTHTHIQLSNHLSNVLLAGDQFTLSLCSIATLTDTSRPFHIHQ